MNIIERIFAGILEAVANLIRGLISGLIGAPSKALTKATAPIDVRRAEPSEVIGLRHQVLRDGRPRDSAIFADDNEPTTRHWIASQAGEVIGVATVLRAPWPNGDGPELQLRGMAVHPGYRGHGVGKAMLVAIEREVGEPMWCNAREGAAGFYAHSGWQGIGELFAIEGVGPHQRMQRQLE